MATGTKALPETPAEALASSPAFLLAKVGADSSRRYKRRLEPLGLEPQQAALLRYIASADGLSQQALADILGLARSRMVVLIDELEQRDLVERRRSPTDRRAYALHLTGEGQKLLDAVLDVSRSYAEELCAPLRAGERTQLVALLQRLAAQQDIPLDVHPDLAS
jgi:DNA-binding MarR family transcriptional regulator